MNKEASPPMDLASNFRHSSIAGLPVELMLRVFHECAPGVVARLRLAHVCRRWLLISQGEPSLWTDIEIRVSRPWNTAHYQHFTALISMQIARCSNRPLDITWTYNTKDNLRNKSFLWMVNNAPCERWRSLKLTVEGEPTRDELDVAMRYATFPNLESLQVIKGHIHSLVDAIQRTKSSKLQQLDLRDFYPRTAEIYKSYARILAQVSHFDLPTVRLFAEPPLPRNITTVRGQQRRIHLFPHVLTYTLDRCIFDTPAKIDLRRLTALTVTVILDVFAGCKVLLPSLRHFTHQEVHLKQDARIEAPKLETLRIGVGGHPSMTSMNSVRGMDLTISHPGYTLAPGRCLAVEMYIPIDSTLRLLTNCPGVEELTLSFSEHLMAMRMMDYILHGYLDAMGHPTAADVCPRLQVLRLLFAWPVWGVEKWKEKAVQLLMSRRDKMGVELEVFAMWEGEGSYVRLA